MKLLYTSLLMFIIGILLPVTVSAYDLKADLTIYYDVTDFGDFSEKKLQVMIGHSSYSICYEMKKVDGYDNLYSVNIGDVNGGNSWGGATQLGFLAESSIWGSEDNSPQHRLGYSKNKTAVYNIPETLSGNVLFTGKENLSSSIIYSIAGNGVAGNPWVNGVDWKPESSKNCLEDGKIRFSKVPEGIYKFKITNGTWSTSYGWTTYFDKSNSTQADYISYTNDSDDNIVLTTTSCLDITIKFNTSTEKITVLAENPDKYFLMGVYGDWDNGIPLVENPSNSNELMLIDQYLSEKHDAVQIVKKSICGDKFYNTIKSASQVPYYYEGHDLVFQEGYYDFYFNKSEENIYVGGEVKKSIKVYLDVRENGSSSNKWDKANARIVLYCYDGAGSTRWVAAKACGDGNTYYALLPEGFNTYIWVRMAPDTENNWDNKWYQTGNIKLDTDKLLTKLIKFGSSTVDTTSEQVVYEGPCKEEYPVLVNIEGEAADLGSGSYMLTASVKDDAGLEIISECGFLLNRAREKGGAFVSENLYIINTKGLPSELPIKTNTVFNASVSEGLVSGYWYGYRAYVKVGEEYSLSPTTKWFFVEHIACDKYEYKTDGDTAFVTIDLKAQYDPCNFVFNSFEQAWATIKTVEDICTVTPVTVGTVTVDRISLKKPVVMLVTAYPEGYSDSEECGASGGDTNDARVIFFRDINTEGGQSLVVRSKEKTGLKATLKHVVIRRSKNITFDYLNITGTSTDFATADNAIDIDNGAGAYNLEGLEPKDWNCATRGEDTTEANIAIKNCNITSSGFTCIHVSAYDDVTFENNEIRAEYDFENAVKSQADNTALWGASAKFINSSNIKFIRNNFVGEHATSILLQGSQKVLIHNNVFWHDNSVSTDVNTVAIIRLMSYQSGGETCAANHKLQNIGIYYNTMFLKNNDVGKGYYHNFDFFRLGGSRDDQTTDGYIANFDPSTIRFENNNCYSYDTDVMGKNNTAGASYYLSTMTETDWCSSFVNNNFWSIWDMNEKNSESAFELGANCAGENNLYINVENQVCNTSPNEPGSLIIKGNELNIGKYIENDASGLLNKEMQMIDRLGKTRPEESGKTLGAYQQSESTEVNLIIWNGEASNEWDNRNNWYKKDGTLVTCMDQLSENLEVIIPASNSENYPTPEGGVKTYPIIPDIITDEEFSARGSKWNGEQVNAGSSGKIANKIFVEYGGSIQGVEYLNAGIERYGEAQVEFVARRHDWLLVGPVIKPWKLDEEENKVTENGKYVTRDVISNDYYLYHVPHVYMHRAEVKLTDADEIEVTWNNSFADLDSVVTHEKAFAIRVPDQYGSKKFPAAVYNARNGTTYNGDAPHTYTNFVGRFYNEKALPIYTGLKTNTPVLLNNTYPANLNASKIAAKGGTVQIYDYTQKAFRYAEDNELILSQHGFIFNPSGIESFSVASEDISNTETGHRDIASEVLSFRVEIENTAYSTASEVYIRIDEEKEDVIDYNVDAPKIFNGMQSYLPDLYVKRYDSNWAGISIPTISEPIPLGIRVSAENQVFTFSLKNSNLEQDVILEDRKNGTTYNLSAGAKYSVRDLAVGKCEGRFYILLKGKEIEDASPDDVGGGVTTDVEEDLDKAERIDIFTQGNVVVISVSDDMELQTIVVSDISGKTQVYKVSGQYIKLDLPVSTGIYTINVVGNKQTRVEKIKLN